MWGDTVNTAARIESHGKADAVNLSPTAWQQVHTQLKADSLGLINIKGKGSLEIFYIT